ncbi:MAG: multicopper oxidase domain-containing protein, partial [Actinobacteria bacterium]|nr:multicopper oxidase domain-containing protein [Actinomycetota bacterium]
SFRARHLPLLAGAAALATLIAACGGSSPSTATANSGDEATPAGTRTVEVAMEDIKFDQTTLTVKTGETIEFRFVNSGKVAHDAFIGDVAAQMEHDAEMAEMGDASGHPMEEAAIVVQPGDSGDLSYTFSEPGMYQVGCHQPGHYAAGMKIDVTVEQ